MSESDREKTWHDLERSERPELTSKIGPANAITKESIMAGAKKMGPWAVRYAEAMFERMKRPGYGRS